MPTLFSWPSFDAGKGEVVGMEVLAWKEGAGRQAVDAEGKYFRFELMR